jgi:hypothetical protein
LGKIHLVGKRVTAQLVEEWRRLHKQGLDCKEIGDRYGFARATVSDYINMGLDGKRRKDVGYKLRVHGLNPNDRIRLTERELSVDDLPKFHTDCMRILSEEGEMELISLVLKLKELGYKRIFYRTLRSVLYKMQEDGLISGIGER